MTIKILLPSLTAYLYGAGFSSFTSTKATYHKRLNAEADDSRAIPIKPDIKEICKGVKQGHSESHCVFFCLVLETIYIFFN